MGRGRLRTAQNEVITMPIAMVQGRLMTAGLARQEVGMAGWRQPNKRAAVISKAAAIVSATAAARPRNRPFRLTVKAEATIARPANTAAEWASAVAIP